MTTAPPTCCSVEVLLATHNGSLFLAEQLDSLLGQDCAAFTIIVSDDHSGDSTNAILAEYAMRYPGRFKLLPPVSNRLGPSGNFARLLDRASADYVLFCDQDDVWHRDKVSLSLARITEIAAQAPPGIPILVHTDLSVVDANLVDLDASFFRYVGLDPARASLAALLLGNIATGCTIIANRALYETARPVPSEAVMFDHWLAQVAAAVGRIDYLRRATVSYRQHSGNAVGAERAGAIGVLKRAGRILCGTRTLSVLTSYSLHAEVLLERYGAQVTVEQRRQLRAMAQLWSTPRWRRFASLIRAGVRKPTITANIGLALLVLRNGSPVRPRKARSCA